MKQLLSIAMLLASTFQGFSQGMFLTAGETYTFEFNTLHFESHLPVPTDPYARVVIGKQDFTGSFLFEAFEDNTLQMPLFSTNVVAGVGPASDFNLGPAWQDLQGVFRVTMESGSMRMVVFLGAVVTPAGDVYSQSVTPVPEPSMLGLLVTAGTPLLLRGRRKH